MDELVAFVLSGKVRVKILRILSKSKKTPTILADDVQTHQSTTSRTLKDLEEKGLVECLTPNNKRSRIYTTTAKGKKVYEEVSRILP